MQPDLKPKKWARFKAWARRHRGVIISVFSVIVIAGVAVGALIFINQKPAEEASNQTPAPIVEEPEPVKYYSPLTGLEVADEAATKQAVTAIMIENSPDARPQSGIKNSGVVFEAIAEGGITRFLVLYQEQKPKLIGPVRSVRMYYVEWAAAFNASIAHIGGSAAALREVRNGKYRDIDQFFNPGAYWRATDRYAPHNVYTNFSRLDALNKAKGYKTSSFTGFSRKDGEPSDEPTATKVTVNISGPTYNSTYVYDKKTNTYARSQGGAKHLDRESGQIKPSVVIGMMVDESTVFEDGYRQSIKTVGSGTAYIFQNGTAQKATWKKASKTKQIAFYGADGKEISLVRGQVWITAVPKGGGSVKWG